MAPPGHTPDETRTRDQLIQELDELRTAYGQLCALLLNVTEGKQAEEQVRDLARFPDENPFPVMRVSTEGKVLYGNPASASLLLSWGTKAGQILPAALVRTVKEVFAKDSPEDVEVAFGHRTFQFCLAPVAEGPYINLYGQDITARKQMENALRSEQELFQTIFQSIPIMLTVYDPSLKMVHINQALYDITGWTPEDVAQDGIMHLVYPDPVYRNQVADYMNSLQPGFKSICMACKDGSVRLTSWANIRISDGRQVGIGVDITEQKETEKALRQLNENLEQLVAERTELAEARAEQLQYLAVELIEAEERERRRIADLLHDDLQQILASARMQVQAIRRSLPEAHALSNVDQLLEKSIEKSRSLSHELNPAILHHASLVQSLEWLSRKMEAQFGLQVHLEADRDHQISSMPLKTFLFRAMQELLFNVCKHAGVDEVHVVLSGSDMELQISVQDGGKGFDPGILESAAAKPGVGLLSLRERTRFIGGSMEIESAPDRGSRFHLTVPLDLEQSNGAVSGETETILPAAAPAAIPATAGSTANLRVLFADDHKVMRKGLIKMMDGQPNIEVAGEAENGREALALARKLRPDVIVMDVTMPEMDGIEATRRIKAELPGVRVIGLSMFEDEQIARTMRKAGAEAFIPKTASTGELLKAIYGMKKIPE